MSISLRICGTPGNFRLVERNYTCQGENPSYLPLRKLTDHEASALARSKLIDPLLCDVPMDPSARPGDFLRLEKDEDGSPFIRLRLPEIAGRSAYDGILPDFGLEKLLQGNPANPSKFLHNTGIAFSGAFDLLSVAPS